MKPIFIALFLFLAQALVYCQELERYEDLLILDDQFEIKESNLDEIGKLNLKNFWIKNPEESRFGFIGSNYRRLDVVFVSIIKDENNPLVYRVYGKSRVSANICEFQGTIEISKSFYLSSFEYFAGKGGVIAGDYHFYEDRDANHPGVFQGRFVTYWNKDRNDSIVYMQLPAIEGNNQFAGTWQGYGTSKSLEANWGDSRIPFSADLDVGTSEFGVNRKYQQYGWDSFIKAWAGGFDKETTKRAREEENKAWWK